MANKQQLLELQTLLTAIEAKYASINKVSPFKGKEAEEVAKNYASVDEALKSAEISMKGIRAEIQDSTSGLEGLKESFRDIGRELGNINSPLKNMKRDFNKLTSLADKLSDINYDLANSTLKETANIRKQVNLSFNRLAQRKKHLITQINSNELSGKALSDAKELLSLAEDEGKHLESKVGYQDDFNKALNDTEKRQRNINNALGVSGGLVKGLGNFASKIGFGNISSALEDINGDMSEMAIKLTDNGNKASTLGEKFKVMGVGLKGLGKTLAKQLLDPAIISGFIMKGLKALYDLKGLSEKRSKEALIATSGALNSAEILKMASASKELTFDDAVESSRILRTELGFIPEITQKTAEAVMNLTRGYGLAGGEAVNLLKTSSELGIDLAKMPEFVAGIGGEVENSTGHAVDFQKAMKTLGNTSASVRFNMKGQANELIKAANYASILGMSMDSIKSASESTLDFESSIQKEMEAEMFLQKNLNLEKYRYAALTGDATGQAEELQRLIKENGPSLKGNVLAQEAFAGAIGISRDQLFDSLEAMELQKKLGFESADAQKALNILMAKGMTKEQAIIKMRKDGALGVTKAIKDQEIFQNRFKKAQEKVQQVFVKLADKIFSDANMGKIDAMIDGISKFLMSPILQKIIKYLPEIAIGFGVLAVLKKFNPIQNVGIMNVARMNGGGGGGGGGGGFGYDGGGSNVGTGTDKKGRKYHYDKKTGKRVKKPTGRKTSSRRRRGGRGLAGMLASTAAYMGADYLMGSMMGGDDSGEEGGGMAGDAAMMAGSMGVNVAADAGINAASNIKPPKPQGTSTLGKMWKGAKNLTSQAGGAIKSVGKKMISPAVQFSEYLSKNIKSIFPKVLKGSKGFLKGAITKIPIAGPLMETLFAGYDINQLAKDKGLTKDELSSEIGKTLISSGLGVLMGSLAVGGVSSLQAIGIPGWLAAPLAYTGGDMVGRMLGNAIADHVGGPALGKGVIDLFGLGGGGASSNAGGMEPPKEMATGGIVTRATNAIVGEAGAEAVIPLNAFYAKIDELITAVKSGGDVYIDGAKVGKSMVMATSRMG